MRKIKKGSFTIEAALLMPLVLMILIGVLYLDFFVYDRAYLTAAAYEAAVSGSMEGYKKKGNIYEKADTQEECWEVSGCWEERILACRQMREKQ